MMDSLNGTKKMNDFSVFKWSPCGFFLLYGEFYPKIKPHSKAFVRVKKKTVGEVWSNET